METRIEDVCCCGGEGVGEPKYGLAWLVVDVEAGTEG
jgi:hypothetical protein